MVRELIENRYWPCNTATKDQPHNATTVHVPIEGKIAGYRSRITGTERIFPSDTRLHITDYSTIVLQYTVRSPSTRY